MGKGGIELERSARPKRQQRWPAAAERHPQQLRSRAPAGSAIPGVFTPTRNLIFSGQVPAIRTKGVPVNTVGLPFQLGSLGDREHSDRVNNTLAYDFDGATLTSLTSYNRRHAEYTSDGDNTICDRTGDSPNFGLPFAPANASGSRSSRLLSSDGVYRDISQELRLASAGTGSTGSRLLFLRQPDGDDRPRFRDVTAAYAIRARRRTPRVFSGFGSLTFHATAPVADRRGPLRGRYEGRYYT